MSEEFSMKAEFTMATAEELEALQECLEHLDMEEKEEARQMLAERALQHAQAQQADLIADGSDYDSKSDIVRMYLGTYQDSVDDHELTLDLKGGTGNFRAEGYDRDAIDFCSAVILLLVAMGASDINASASSAFWAARWKSDINNGVIMTYATEE